MFIQVTILNIFILQEFNNYLLLLTRFCFWFTIFLISWRLFFIYLKKYIYIINRYCHKVNKKLESPGNEHRQIVHYTSQREHKRANAAYLVASFAVLYLNKSPREAYNTLFMGGEIPIKPFRDASMGSAIYSIHLLGDII